MSQDDELLAKIAAAKLENYLPLDIYRDFREVFLGSDAGKRVLREILSWGHVNQSSAQRAQFDTNKTFYYDGQRSIGIKAMMTINNEPPSDLPTKATNEEPE